MVVEFLWCLLMYGDGWCVYDLYMCGEWNCQCVLCVVLKVDDDVFGYIDYLLQVVCVVDIVGFYGVLILIFCFIEELWVVVVVLVCEMCWLCLLIVL